MNTRAEISEDAAGPRNRLGRSTSPYLLQHRDNPVAWREWGPEALQEAREKDKPLLVSFGYAACHWCHVMAHESFEDPEIAQVMNDLFVSIKIDREERPDLDHIYQTALAGMGQHGGWPLTMFCTPDGRPYWGGTYFPKTPMLGRPGFAEVLKSAAYAYHQQKDRVESNTGILTDLIQKSEAAPGPAEIEIGADLFRQAAKVLGGAIDRDKGGFQGAPKFPCMPQTKMAWAGWTQYGDEHARDAVLITLRQMGAGGIYDHLGGGFARYSVDEDWLVPHFEKMLYDNALILEMLCEVWLETGDPVFAEKIRETAAWALREMRGPGDAEGNRAFIASYDADSEGQEGRFYVWHADEIDAVLDADTARLFKSVYDVSEDGNWEGVNILNRLDRPESLSAEEEQRLRTARDTLFQAREKRVRPAADGKILTDWNGLMIHALARAGNIFDEPEWRQAAESAYEFLIRNHQTEDGRLIHSTLDGRTGAPGLLEDYAALIRAACTLHETSGEAAHPVQARAWLDRAVQDFYDTEQGGFFQTAADVSDILVRPRPVRDSAVPAPNGLMLEAMARLAHIRPEPELNARIDGQIRAFSAALHENIFALCAFMTGLIWVYEGLYVTLEGPADHETYTALKDVLFEKSRPFAMISIENSDDSHDSGDSGGPARPRVRVCRTGVCQAPVDGPEALRQALDEE